MVCVGNRHQTEWSILAPDVKEHTMTHVHYCPDCQKSWDCVSRDCEKYQVYLCLPCYKALLYPHCRKAIAGAAGKSQKEENPNQSEKGSRS